MYIKRTSFLLASFLLVSNGFTQEETYLQPDSDDYAIIESCLKDNSLPERYGAFICIGRIADRCEALHLPIIPQKCIEREENAWITIRTQYFNAVIERLNEVDDDASEFIATDSKWRELHSSDCDFLSDQLEGLSKEQTMVLFECSRNIVAEQALHYKWALGRIWG